jgi:uncharacterized protein (AIM24 family)
MNADLPPGISFGGDVLTLNLETGDVGHVRRSCLILAEGPFKMTSHMIAKRRFSVIGTFSGQVRWANRFEAEEAPVSILAGRDFFGTVVTLHVSEDAPIYIQPGSYLAHQGELVFNTERVAKKEFWTLTNVSGNGIVHLKIPGRPTVRAMREEGAVTDTNYVAAICGTFEAHGKVFKAKELIKSGEMENVRLSGAGHVIFQSQNPEEVSDSGGGGIWGLIGDLLPF